MSRDTFKAKGNPPISQELASYIAEYVNEEYRRTYHNHRTGPFPTITEEMILKAIDAYEGGAR